MKQILVFVLISVAFCTCQESNDTRCSIYDSDCQKTFFQDVAGKKATTGIPELGIQIIDPFKVTNYILSILGLLYVKFNGEAEGIGKCVVTKFVSNVEEGYREVEFNCTEIIIRGHYVLTPAPVMGNICGWCNIHGEGNGSVVLEDWVFKLKYDFRIVKRDDGNIYLDPLFDQAVYEATVKKVTVKADCIKQGSHDITNYVISFINSVWKYIMDSCIGKSINDQSMQYYYDIYKTFYYRSPAETFLKDNLTLLLDKE